MKKIYSLIAICIFAVATFAQTTLTEWAANSTNNPGGLYNFGPNPFGATSSNNNLTIGGLTRGSGFLVPSTGSASGATSAWGGTDLTSANVDNAIAAGDFATFTITPKAGYSVSISGIDSYNVRRSNSGATNGQWQFQVGSGTFTNIGSVINWGTGTSNAGNEQSAIDLSGITQLQNVTEGTTLTFRIVAYGGSASGGTFYLTNGHANATSNTLTVRGLVQTATLAVSDFNKSKSNFIKNTFVKNGDITFGADVKDVKVYTLTGQVVKIGSVKNGATLNVAELQKGNYIVTGTVNNQPVSQKILKD